jgi:ABC-type multidrug transport system fused ATPase/permease subunit
VLEKGRVVEQGDHEEVYDKAGTYKAIFDAMAHSLNIEKIAKTLNE